MGVVFSLAEALNLLWGMASDETKTRLDERMRNAAFRRRLARRVSEALESAGHVDARTVGQLLDDPEFFAFVANPHDEGLRRRVDDGRLDNLLGSAPNPQEVESLARELAMVVEAAVVDQATPEDRLLHARLSEVSATQIEVVRLVLDLHDRLDSEVDRDPNTLRELRVLVHRARFMQPGGGVDESQEEHFFIKMTNLSPSRPLEVTHIWFDTDPRVDLLDRPLPKRLALDETFETWVPVRRIPHVPNPGATCSGADIER